jgi:hypothetical protein
MALPFMFRRGHREVATLYATYAVRAHEVASDYDEGRCRFVLTCSCGIRFDTPYIDEALEWHEMHELLAPLADQMVA